MEKFEKNSEKFYCKSCQFRCGKLTEWSRHIATSKHLGLKKPPKKITQFTCEKCDVICSTITKWNIHIATKKHTELQKGPKKLHSIYACKKCNKEYTLQSSVRRHETKCESRYVSLIDRLLHLFTFQTPILSKM
jgi:hypothetical protein